MKRMLYIIILVLVITAPVKPLKTEQLLPVSVLSASREGNWFILKTDTDHKGIGKTGKEALQNLKETASGVIYLPTTRFLLLEADAVDVVEDLRAELKKSVRVCKSAAGDLAEAGKYLQIHGQLPTLSEWENGAELPVLVTLGKNYTFLKKVEKSS